VRLQPGRERQLRFGHPWVLSGSVDTLRGDPVPGDVVRVVAADGSDLGLGDYDPGSQIRVRMLGGRGMALEAEPEGWLEERLEAASRARQVLPQLRDTDAWRLAHAEGDALPGLTIDRYARWAVLKASTPAMARRALAAAHWLMRTQKDLEGVWLRGDLRGTTDLEERTLLGQVPDEPIEIQEHGRRYWLDLRRGQKTGFYLDQRDARDLCQALAKGRRMLDLYAYTGGFSLAALAGGAQGVSAVESSGPAAALLARNAPGCARIVGDVGDYLQSSSEHFDLITIDPPPFARHKRDVEAACRAYRELHVRALGRATAGAHVLTFTCSHHVDATLFRRTVSAAAHASGRRITLLGTLGAPADHPVALSHPEGEYLTGLWLHVGPR